MCKEVEMGLNYYRHKTLKERLADYSGDYVGEEWDIGEPMGKEVF